MAAVTYLTMTEQASGRISLSRLRLVAIVAPVGFLAAVFFLLQGPAHYELHHFPADLYMLLGLSAIVLCFTFVVFGIIERLERQVLRQNRHLSVLNEIAATATERLELDEFLNAALDDVLDVIHADVGVIWLIEEETQELSVACHRGLSEEQALEVQRRELARDPIAEGAIRAGRPVVFERVLEHPQVAELARWQGFRSAIALPAKAEGMVYGVLAVITRDERRFQPAEIELLSSIAGQLGLATRNARLRERVLDRAVLEERERLGRELHDSLGQMVGYVNTQTLAVKKLLASGDRAEAERHLGEMERTAEKVCADVREAILGLRTSVSGLLPSLRTYLADYGRLAETRVTLEASADVEALALRASTETQLMRIVQEALSNVRRHACAGSATVRLETADGELTVEVADDGRGFDRDELLSAGWPRFGLDTMRERAEAIAGTFTIDSSPGRGTRVTVRVPVRRTAEVAHARAAR